MLVQVRAMVEMLPKIEVVADDAFNSDPADPKNMGPEARQRHAAGETLPTAHVPTPLVGAVARGCSLVSTWTRLLHGIQHLEDQMDPDQLPARANVRRITCPSTLSAGHSNSKLHAEARHGAQVELPLGATEDRICGTIDIEKALQEGIKAYEPGLLVGVRCGCLGGGLHEVWRSVC